MKIDVDFTDADGLAIQCRVEGESSPRAVWRLMQCMNPYQPERVLLKSLIEGMNGSPVKAFGLLLCFWRNDLRDNTDYETCDLDIFSAAVAAFKTIPGVDADQLRWSDEWLQEARASLPVLSGEGVAQ